MTWVNLVCMRRVWGSSGKKYIFGVSNGKFKTIQLIYWSEYVTWVNLVCMRRVCGSSGKLTSNALLFMAGPGGADAVDVLQLRPHKSTEK